MIAGLPQARGAAGRSPVGSPPLAPAEAVGGSLRRLCVMVMVRVVDGLFSHGAQPLSGAPRAGAELRNECDS